jgi:N-acyl homoserine lactone hydrolase
VDLVGARIELLDGDDHVVDGVQILATPGHTPGHQSVVVDREYERVVICAQAAFTPTDFAAHQTRPRNTPTEDEATQRRSIQLLHDVRPDRV